MARQELPTPAEPIAKPGGRVTETWFQRFSLMWAAVNTLIQGNTIELTDGVDAPDAIEGRVQIYVDSSSGDLKVIFGDGVIKTIVVDT